jgi:hypothetical protein
MSYGTLRKALFHIAYSYIANILRRVERVLHPSFYIALRLKDKKL